MRAQKTPFLFYLRLFALSRGPSNRFNRRDRYFRFVSPTDRQKTQRLCPQRLTIQRKRVLDKFFFTAD